MQNKFFALLLVVAFVLPAQAYNLTHIDSKVKSIGSHEIGSTIQIEITQNDEDEEDNYPVGTVLSGTFIKHKERRRISRPEFVKIHFTSATLPNGKVEKIDRIVKLVPRTEHRNTRWGGNMCWLAAGISLGYAADFLTLGLPIGRGGIGLWNAYFDAVETDGSRWKAAGKGFLRGALMPLPWLVLKGQELDLEPGVPLEFKDDDPDDKEVVGFHIKPLGT